MKLRSLNKYISLLILVFIFLPLNAEEEIDIWNKTKKKNSQLNKNNQQKITNNSESIFSTQNNESIEIQNEILKTSK